MPLRSVEAATRDDAIAAAREQFGPQVRIVGVRRVRSGGVLGFFATERYVAEVAPDVPRPPAPEDAPRDHGLGPSPLASAAAATAAPPDGRPRGGAPARNGAAAYAAEAIRSAAPAEPDAAPRPVRPATQAAARTLGWPAGDAVPTAAPAVPTAAATVPAAATAVPAAASAVTTAADDPRLGDFARLLASPSEPRPSARPRASARSGEVQKVTFAKASWAMVREPEDEPADNAFPATEPATGAPSPFTAALARMVAGDAHVQQAVREAVEVTEKPGAGLPRRHGAERRPSRPTHPRTAQPAVQPEPAHQEEETVGDQVVAPPSMPGPQPLPAEVPPWAAAPEVTDSADSAREEAIAEVLRAALAQGHSDEALAGLLRKVLDGASPRAALPDAALADLSSMPDTALPEPALPQPAQPETVLPDAVLADGVPAGTDVLATALTEVSPQPTAAGTSADALFGGTEAGEPRAALAGAVPCGDVPSLPPVDIWGTASAAALWGGSTPAEVVADDAPGLGEPVVAEPVAPDAQRDDEDAADEDGLEEAAEDTAAEDTAAEDTAAEDTATEDTATEDTVLDEVVVQELPLARTASDLAPRGHALSMSDATSVMPPLSLLPPLPSSRGRGRPPVPTTAARPARRTPEAASAPQDAPEPAASTGAALATVTRLPLAALPAGPEVADPELADPPVADGGAGSASAATEPPTRETLRSGTTSTEPAAPPTTPETTTPEATTPEATSTPSDVVAGLAALGLPPRLLGDSFDADVERHGVYAALTRALGLRLPAAPQVPTGAGEVLFVVGPGAETLRAARSLAASLCLDPDRVQWATRGDLAGLTPDAGRMTTIDAAIARRHDATSAGTVTIVAVDAPMRTDAYWMAQMLAIWSPVAVWAVVDATRKPEDVEPWLDAVGRVDALIVQDTDVSADPAAVLHRVAAPVAVLDGMRATPHRWASLLCERLDDGAT